MTSLQDTVVDRTDMTDTVTIPVEVTAEGSAAGAVAESTAVGGGSPKQRVYSLDLLRLLAAVLVLLFHYAYRGQFSHTTFSYAAIEPVAKYGWLGVELFFVISGYVILLSAGRRTASQFLEARIVRLYPAFWICCCLTALVINLLPWSTRHIGLVQWLASMTMVPRLLKQPDVSAVYWTLLEEIKFYAFVFVLLWSRQLPKLERYLWAWFAVALGAVLAQAHVLSFAISAEYAPFFIFGCAIYLGTTVGWTRQRLALVAASTAFGLLSVWLLTAGQPPEMVYSPLAACGVMAILMTLFAAVVVVPIEIRWKYGVTFGALTYPLYLIHEEIGYLIFNFWNSPYWLGMQLASVTLLMFVAAWLITLVEKPGQRLLKAALDTLPIFAPQPQPVSGPPRPAGLTKRPARKSQRSS